MPSAMALSPISRASCFLPGVHKLTLLLGLLAIVLFIIGEIQQPQKEAGLQL